MRLEVVEEDEVDGVLVALVDVELALIDDQVVREGDNDVELFVVVLLLMVDAAVELADVLLDVVEESRCCGGGAGCACGREGCRCRAGGRRCGRCAG